jgi:hypothetical protein
MKLPNHPLRRYRPHRQCQSVLHAVEPLEDMLEDALD